MQEAQSRSIAFALSFFVPRADFEFLPRVLSFPCSFPLVNARTAHRTGKGFRL